ncbi:IS110 family transposase [Mycobacterium kansasii]|uniref:IS110 family transposase n=1 Tax=Mycobacterium kansasii TaxID=1768 RepID=A0A7G1IK85_MYCKA|nr:IS110 family transposase [Mycobacterium kansasii]
MLTDKVDFVIGVDTHRDSHTAAIVTAAGGLVERLTVATDAFGFRKLDTFAAKHATGRRVWAIEGTGSFGAGLTTHLLGRGEWVVEIDRPARPARRDGAKSDDLDAVRAAREALTREHLAAPRARGDREAMRVLLAAREGAILARTKAIGQLKAMIVNAPNRCVINYDAERPTNNSTAAHVLRTLPSHSVEHRATVRAIRATARRALMLEAEAAEHETELELLVTAACPQLLDRPGIGVITAAQFLISWSHRDRIRSEAAFASLAGAAPIPASSGATVRHRLNRAGDRQLNRALHTVALTRLRFEPTTKAYAARRTAEGKTPREIKRCLKRAIAREVYRIMQTDAASITTIETAA